MAGRTVQLELSNNRWQVKTGAPVQGAPAWAAYSKPAHQDVQPASYVPAKPVGCAKWPNFPVPDRAVSFTNPRSGAVESFLTVDPAKVEPAGPVVFSGWPRQSGDAPFIVRDAGDGVWNPATNSFGDRSYTWDRFIWADDLIAQGTTGQYSHALGGYDLRKLTFAASDVATQRGVWGILVLPKAQCWAPDLTDGWQNGVRLGSDGTASTTGTRATVKLLGIVGQGPESVVSLATNFTPTTSQISQMKIGGTGTNDCCIIGCDQIPEPVYFANFVGTWANLNNAGAELMWNGLRIENNTGAVVERIGTRGWSSGYQNVPPGETDSLSFNHCDKPLERDCLWDGRDLNGNRRSSSLVGNNSTTNIRAMRSVTQYGRAGMRTAWLCNGIEEWDCLTYSPAAGGADLAGNSGKQDGSGRNVEESGGRIRLFFPRHFLIGSKGSDTANVDYQPNASFWLSYLGASTASGGYGYDPGADMVIYEPGHASTDFTGFDANGRLSFASPLNYQGTSPTAGADNTSTAKTFPQVYRGGKWLVVGGNVDPASVTSSTSTRVYRTTAQKAGFDVLVAQ